MTPLVSVLIPLYNHAAYIVDCLDSIAREGYPRIEVIVVDDGSSDASYDLSCRWRDAHPDAFERFEIVRQPNRGIPVTLNRLVSLARGSYLTLLASDDFLLPGGLGARLEGLQRHPEWLAVFADCRVVDANGAPLHESGLSGLHRADKALLADPRFIGAELALRWAIPGPVLLAHRRVYDPVEGIGPYDESMSVEDRDFYLKLLKRGALGFVDAVVAGYRLHDSNAFKQEDKRRRHFESMLRVEQKHLADFRGFARAGVWLRLQRYRHALAEGGSSARVPPGLERALAALQGVTYRLHRLRGHLAQRIGTMPGRAR